MFPSQPSNRNSNRNFDRPPLQNRPQRRRPKPFGTEAPAILMSLAILVFGFIYAAVLLAFPVSAHNAGPGAIEQAANGFSGRTTWPYPLQNITATPTHVKQFSFSRPATPTPQPSSTPTAPPPPAVASVPTLIPTPALTASTQSEIEHVIIITIDGMRPDAMTQAETPNIDKLMARGAYNPKAQTISLSITLPSHTSMLTGVKADKHGIQWGLPYIGWPGLHCSTAFSVAHDAGLSTAMVFGKEKLNYMILPHTVDEVFGHDAHDPEVKDHALEVIEGGLPNLMFVHFPDTDRVGHAFGWMSQNQLYAINFADAMIGEILTALENEGYLDSTLLIITADHGGHDKGHGDDAPIDRTIPWLAAGPGVPQGVILYNQINTYDTAATALYALNLPIPKTWDGKPVLEIFPNRSIKTEQHVASTCAANC